MCVCVGVGPDICGPGTKKVHVILSHKGENKLTKKDIRCKVSNSATYAYNFIQSQNFSLLPLLPVPLVFLPSLLSSPLSPTQDDEFTHLYTLILRPDNTYEVKIDNKRVEGGPIQDNWDMLLPTEILDPEATKPEDWDDRAKIPDPEDTKSEVRKRDDLILHCQCLCRWLCPSLSSLAHPHSLLAFLSAVGFVCSLCACFGGTRNTGNTKRWYVQRVARCQLVISLYTLHPTTFIKGLLSPYTNNIRHITCVCVCVYWHTPIT